MICTVCSLRFSMTVVAWMHMKAVNTIWKWSSANVFWIHYLAGFWIPMPSIRDSTSKNFLDSGIRITLHGAICEIWWPDSTLSLSDLMTEQHPKLLAKTGVVRWLDLWSLFQLDKLVHKAPVLTCSSICTKRFYELWRCAALSSIFKSSFSSNAICICFFWRLYFPRSLECGSGLGWQTASEMKRKVRKWDATRSLQSSSP